MVDVDELAKEVYQYLKEYCDDCIDEAETKGEVFRIAAVAFAVKKLNHEYQELWDSSFSSFLDSKESESTSAPEQTVVLTPKTEAPQFKEGDAVKIINYCDEMYLPPQIVGAEGMVEEANRPNGNILVSVAKGFGNGMTWAVPPKCLELLPKPTTLEINGQPFTVPEGYRVCSDDELWQEGMVYSHDTEGEPWYDTYRPTVSKEVCSKRDVATIKSKYMNKGGVILAPVTSKPVVK